MEDLVPLLKPFSLVGKGKLQIQDTNGSSGLAGISLQLSGTSVSCGSTVGG